MSLFEEDMSSIKSTRKKVPDLPIVEMNFDCNFTESKNKLVTAQSPAFFLYRKFLGTFN